MSSLGNPASFDLAGTQAAGDSSAGVTVVVYACTRCPFCSKVVPDLYRKVTSGALKGKVKLLLRPFPIRGHEGSVEGGLALLAAARMGKLWPYLNRLYSQFDSFSVDRLAGWASDVGLDRSAFVRAMQDPASREALVRAKKEGLKNGVSATPTLFINGRRYQGGLEAETLDDVLGEEVDRVAGRQYCEGAERVRLP